MRRGVSAVGRLMLTLVISSGCSVGESEPAPDTSSPSSSVAPASGPSVAGSGYAYRAPKGWLVLPEDPPGFDFDSLSADGEAGENDFTESISVGRFALREARPLNFIEGPILSGLKMQGATDIKKRSRTHLEDAEAIHFTTTSHDNDAAYNTETFGIVREKTYYLVTFNFSTDRSRAERQRVFDSVLATWHWD